MPIINIKGVDIYFQQQAGSVDHGSLLYIHGSGSTHEVWSQQMNLKLNSIALDLPGHGQSEGNAARSIAESADVVASFISAIKLPRPLYLVGHSMGAAIVISCALNYPELLDGIILIGSGQRMKVNPAFLEALSQGKSDPGFIRLGFATQTPEAIIQDVINSRAGVAASVLYADFSACNEFDVSHELEKICLPTLVIVGAEDKLTPLKLSQFISSHINNCQLQVITEAGHFVMLEKPEELNRLISEFTS